MIYLGIGSNLSSNVGNRIKNIDFAISKIQEKGILVNKKSSFYETFSQPNKNDPKFINLVISIKSKMSPVELMSTLITIEKTLGRQRNKKNDPRTCDIDIIDFNGLVKKFYIHNTELILPHERLEARNFVLHPLKEISPNWTHPKTKKNIDILIHNLKDANNEITKLV